MTWGVLFAIISNLSFGISNVYWKRAAVNDSFSRIVFYRGLITLAVFVLTFLLTRLWDVPLLFFVNNHPSVTDVATAIAICAGCSLGLVFYLRSLRYGPVSISVPLSSINLFSILTAVFILGETFKYSYYAAFLLAAGGVMLLHRKSANMEKGLNKGVLYSLLASFFWGVGYALFKLPAKTIGALPLAMILETCVLITAWVWNRMEKEQKHRIQKRPPATQVKHYAVLAALLVCGTLFFNFAIQRTDVLVLNLLGNTCLLTSVLLGVVVEKEKLSLKQVMGITSIILSLVVVQLL